MKLKSTEPHDYQLDGFRANIKGKPVNANPHPKGTRAYESWHRGWYTANFGRMMNIRSNAHV